MPLLWRLTLSLSHVHKHSDSTYWDVEKTKWRHIPSPRMPLLWRLFLSHTQTYTNISIVHNGMAKRQSENASDRYVYRHYSVSLSLLSLALSVDPTHSKITWWDGEKTKWRRIPLPRMPRLSRHLLLALFRILATLLHEWHDATWCIYIRVWHEWHAATWCVYIRVWHAKLICGMTHSLHALFRILATLRQASFI